MLRITLSPGMDWPPAISDGLTLPCSMCGQAVPFDFTVTDEAWETAVPERWRRGVLCLRCFDRLLDEAGGNLDDALLRVQFTASRGTILLTPAVSWRYMAKQEAKPS